MDQWILLIPKSFDHSHWNHRPQVFLKIESRLLSHKLRFYSLTQKNSRVHFGVQRAIHSIA